jgi:hypothetical protein
MNIAKNSAAIIFISLFSEEQFSLIYTR